MLVGDYAATYRGARARLYGLKEQPAPPFVSPEERRRAVVGRAEACRPPRATDTLARLLANVAAKHGVLVADMRGPRRSGRILAARHEYYYRAYMHHRGKTLTQIADVCGKDHSTVYTGARLHADLHGLPFVKRTSRRPSMAREAA